MSTPIKDGGAAFPRGRDAYGSVVEGMSLRDWFAGQVLAGYLASLTEREAVLFGDPFDVAKTSYAYADAMLKAREVAQ